MTATSRLAVFGGIEHVPAEVGGLYLEYAEAREEHDPVTVCRYRADTADGHWLGANTFLYDRGRRLEDGAESADVVAERDQSLRVLRGGAIEPVLLGNRRLSLPDGVDRRLSWQWAALRDGPLDDAVITHVAIRVDRGCFDKVLLSYPAPVHEIGRRALVAFLLAWHRCVMAA